MIAWSRKTTTLIIFLCMFAAFFLTCLTRKMMNRMGFHAILVDMREDAKKKSSHLNLVYSAKLQDEPLSDHDININRLDALLESLSMYENDEDPYNFLLTAALIDLLKVKQMYLAWLDEEY